MPLRKWGTFQAVVEFGSHGWIGEYHDDDDDRQHFHNIDDGEYDDNEYRYIDNDGHDDGR